MSIKNFLRLLLLQTFVFILLPFAIALAADSTGMKPNDCGKPEDCESCFRSCMEAYNANLSPNTVKSSESKTNDVNTDGTTTKGQ